MTTFCVTKNEYGEAVDIEADEMEIIDGCLIFSIVEHLEWRQIEAFAPGAWLYVIRGKER